MARKAVSPVLNATRSMIATKAIDAARFGRVIRARTIRRRGK
jgi:hypothetical protein